MAAWSKKTTKLHRFEILFLALIMLVGFFLRAYKINTDLLFHRDQGLHALAIWNIWHEGKLSLLGPLSDVDGLTHAPIFYWLLTPAYALSGGSPVAAVLFLIALEMFSLPFLYLGVKKLFNQSTALLTLLIYVFSYGLISYSRWLVNVPPILPLMNIFVYFLSLYLIEKPRPLYLFCLSLLVGLSTQIDAAVGIFVFPFLLWLLSKKFSPLKLMLLLLGFFLPALPLLAFEFRHQFVITRALLNFSQSSQQGLGLKSSILFGNFRLYLGEISKVFSYPYFSPATAALAFSLFNLRRHRHRLDIFLFLILPIIGLAAFKRGAISFFYLSLLPFSLAVISYGLARLPKAVLVILLSLILILNLRHLPKIYRPTNALIPIGNANLITLQDRKNILDWVYQQAAGEPFAVWFYTRPYFQEDVWQYLFLWYAQPQYGYLPEKTGSFSPGDLDASRHFFAIWEPDPDNPRRFNSWREEVVLNFGLATDSYQSNDLFAAHHSLVE